MTEFRIPVELIAQFDSPAAANAALKAIITHEYDPNKDEGITPEPPTLLLYYLYHERPLDLDQIKPPNTSDAALDAAIVSQFLS